jgi:hypothetical protein
MHHFIIAAGSKWLPVCQPWPLVQRASWGNLCPSASSATQVSPALLHHQHRSGADRESLDFKFGDLLNRLLKILGFNLEMNMTDC